MVCVDEAHTLTQQMYAPGKPEEKTLYDCPISSFSDYATDPVFLVSLSTDPNLEALAPAACNRKVNQMLIAPFTEMPFDLISDVIQPDVYTAREVASLTFMAKFDRPL